MSTTTTLVTAWLMSGPCLPGTPANEMLPLNPRGIPYLMTHPPKRPVPLLTRSNADTKAAIKAYFADVPAMISIAHCESTFRQYTPSGATFTGGGGRYIGAFQISAGHIPAAKRLGIDICTLEGNMAYARYLYLQQGTSPWRGCVTAVLPPPPRMAASRAQRKTK